MAAAAALGAPSGDGSGGWRSLCRLFREYLSGEEAPPKGRLEMIKMQLSELDAIVSEDEARGDEASIVPVALELLLTLMVQHPSLEKREHAVDRITSLPIAV